MSRWLRDAGWFEGRAVDSDGPLRQLQVEGHPVDEWFSQVIREFDDLTIEFVRNGRLDQIVLSPGEAGRRWFPEVLAAYGDRVGEPLVPVGYTYHEHLILLVDERGIWYGGHEEDLWRVGGSVAEAVDQIVSGAGFEPVA